MKVQNKILFVMAVMLGFGTNASAKSPSFGQFTSNSWGVTGVLVAAFAAFAAYKGLIYGLNNQFSIQDCVNQCQKLHQQAQNHPLMIIDVLTAKDLQKYDSCKAWADFQNISKKMAISQRMLAAALSKDPLNQQIQDLLVIQANIEEKMIERSMFIKHLADQEQTNNNNKWGNLGYAIQSYLTTCGNYFAGN